MRERLQQVFLPKLALEWVGLCLHLFPSTTRKDATEACMQVKIREVRVLVLAM
jgi:hypothetical protein